MIKYSLIVVLFAFSFTGFSQAREDYEEGNYRKIYSIVIRKDGKTKHVIKQGAFMSSKVDGKVIKGRWFFKAYPDVVSIVNNEGKVLGEVELNKEILLRIMPPQNQSNINVGIGVGPVSISGLGGGMKNFNMKKYHAEINERRESKQEKSRRDYYEKERKEQLEKEAEKKAKKEKKITGKKKKKE